MSIQYFKTVGVVMIAMLFGGISAMAADPVRVRHVPGEITWVDVNTGKLQIKADATRKTGAITEYRVSQHETRVTSPQDKQFLAIEDLQAGQHVTIDVVRGQEDQIVQQIVVDTKKVKVGTQEAYGEVETVDGIAGTLALSRKSRLGEPGDRVLMHFYFDPLKVLVMQGNSSRAVQLQLKTGDVVKVVYVVKDAKPWAKSITLYTPEVVRTTTTTTVTTIR